MSFRRRRPGGVIIGNGVSTPFVPTDLGVKLIDWFLADDLVDGAPASWTSKKLAAVFVAAGGPVKASNSFNGKPGVTFDGVDDLFELGSCPYPAGAATSGCWVLCQQNALAADVTDRIAFSWGAVALTERTVGRIVVTGVNRGKVFTGVQSAVDTFVDLSSRHVIRGHVGAGTATLISVDGNGLSSVSATPATTATRSRIGANALAAATGSFWNGVIREIIVEDGTLTPSEANALQNYLLARR